MANENRELSSEYYVTAQCGEGGCSVVYEGCRYKDNRHAVLKILRIPSGLSIDDIEMTRRRFFYEARIISSLNNPHSIEYLDFGLFNGEPCMALEYIDGIQLDEYLKKSVSLSFEDSVDIICQVLECLAEIHEKGVIHRDIKPANIMVLNHIHPLEIRVIDFGIATILENKDDYEDRDMLRTKVGSIRGTPSYMAPELFSGTAKASAESDIFAVGLVLAECLTGNICVPGNNMMQIAFKQIHEELKLPIFIPGCLADVILKCCAKSPEDRYHKAQDVIDDLKRVLPMACEQRIECHEAYLEYLKSAENVVENQAVMNTNIGVNVDVRRNSISPLVLGLAIALFLSLLAIVAVFLIKDDESSNLQADVQDDGVVIEKSNSPAAGLPENIPQPDTFLDRPQKTAIDSELAGDPLAVPDENNAPAMADETKDPEEVKVAANGQDTASKPKKPRQKSYKKTATAKSNNQKTSQQGKRKDTSGVANSIY